MKRTHTCGELRKHYAEKEVQLCGWVHAIRTHGNVTFIDLRDRYGITQTRPLADFLPTLTIAAKNLATEMTNHNVQQDDLQGEHAITREHVQNNESVRDMLGQRGIKPEQLPPEEDIEKLERRVKAEEKKLVKRSGRLPAKNQGQ